MLAFIARALLRLQDHQALEEMCAQLEDIVRLVRPGPSIAKVATTIQTPAKRQSLTVLSVCQASIVLVRVKLLLIRCAMMDIIARQAHQSLLSTLLLLDLTLLKQTPSLKPLQSAARQSIRTSGTNPLALHVLLASTVVTWE